MAPRPKRPPKKLKNSRNKGKVGELELAAFLTERGYKARRGQQFKGGTDSPDVVAAGLEHIHIECKRVEAGNPYIWLDQAQRDAAGKKTPVVMHRKNNREWIVILTLEDFLTQQLTRAL